MTDPEMQLRDPVLAEDRCENCGHTAEEHADDLPARCLAHGDVHPCDCEAFEPEAAEEAEVAA